MEDPEPDSESVDERFVNMCFKTFEALQHEGHEQSFETMGQDVMSIRATIRNMLRRRAQVAVSITPPPIAPIPAHTHSRARMSPHIQQEGTGVSAVLLYVCRLQHHARSSRWSRSSSHPEGAGVSAAPSRPTTCCPPSASSTT